MASVLSVVKRGQGAGKGTATSEIKDILGLDSSEKDVPISFPQPPRSRKGRRFWPAPRAAVLQWRRAN